MKYKKKEEQANKLMQRKWDKGGKQKKRMTKICKKDRNNIKTRMKTDEKKSKKTKQS